MSISGWVEMTIPPGCWVWWRGRPAASRESFTSASQRGEPPAGTSSEMFLLCVRPGIDPPRQPLYLARRQAQRLGEVAHRRAHPEGGESGHERAAVAAVALVQARDQHVADVAREVEIDVRQRGELLVEEAAEEELVLHRVDVREAGRVADDRGHARARPRPGGSSARRVRPPHLHGHLPRQLEHVAVEEEEAEEPQVADHPQLLIEPPLGLGPGAPAAVAVPPAARDRPRPGRCPLWGPPSPDSGSPGPRSGRTGAVPPAGRSPPPRRGGRRSARPSARAE